MNHYLPDETLRTLAAQQGTPLYVNSIASFSHQADVLMGLTMPYGFQPRYAAKANMNREIIALFAGKGLYFDASSSYEAVQLIEHGVAAHTISLSSQQPAHNLSELLAQGVIFTATSLHQLALFCEAPGRSSTVGLRVNPGVGAGGNNRTNTGGVNSSFGLWHAYIPQALQLVSKCNVTIDRLHIHFGSGASPDVWESVIASSLEVAERMPDVSILNIGGGFKVYRYEGEKEADLVHIAEVLAMRMRTFADKTGRELKLEIEPGTWLVAHGGTLLTKVIDIVDTGVDGHTFLRVNTGMNDLIRPTLYGAQHKISVLNDSTDFKEYVVVGHNCETGDILTPAPGNSEELAARTLLKANIGDTIAIYDVGAYGRSFALSGYNSYPSAPEICI
ncbi:diaminopimelate decarboxylase [Candidatus Saccharibacteria bacterium]|nr:diaminopimelate decarboxylase [Candidatus Saccharibacteria bacterium]